MLVTISNIVGVANATLITDLTERDWKVAGDKALTYDSSTGLEWLDLTWTLGNSILDTEAESFFGDFRWATESEIENVFDAVLLGSGYRTSTNPSVNSAASQFLNMFGTPSDSATEVQGVSRGSVKSISGDLTSYGLGHVSHFPSSQFVAVNDPLTNCCWIESNSQKGVGSWLVRAGASTAVVPEPSSLAIFALGVIGLTTRRFKKQS